MGENNFLALNGSNCCKGFCSPFAVTCSVPGVYSYREDKLLDPGKQGLSAKLIAQMSCMGPES